MTALEPARKAGKVLQQQHLTLVDFYGIWLRCKLQISKALPTEFSQLLLSSIKTRELALLENNIFLACIFLDPRYKVLLNEEENMSTLSAYLQTWRLSHTKMVTAAFHLNNREAKRELKVYNNGRLLPFRPTPTYLGVKLDRAICFVA